MTAIVYVDGSQESFTYDAVGNVLSSTNRRGQTVTYTYNAAGQVTSKKYDTTPGVTDLVYHYDAAGNLIQAIDASGSMQMTYDPNTDWLTRIEYPSGQFFAFQYDTLGRRTQRADQDGNVVNYQYDAAGRLDRMTDGADVLIVDYDYDAAGRLSLKTLGNGVYTTYEYDSAGNILHLINYQPDSTVLSRYDYEYDVSGRRIAMTTLEGTFQYGYDALGQLIAVRHPDDRVVTYEYDAVGNRRQVIDGSEAIAYTSNALNQYLLVGDVLYEYDLDGNLISKTEDGVTTTYRYDIENRLIEVETPTDIWTYHYDAFGNRSTATHNGQVVQYIVDPTGLGNVAAEYDADGNLIARYDHGYGLLSRVDVTGDSAFYTFQAIGHTSELTGADGAVLNTYAYDPWGVSLGKAETVPNPFQFVGEYGVMNEGNGLEFMRARFFDATIGRFTQEDPIGISGGINLYNYVRNAPSRKIDPSGHGRGRFGDFIDGIGEGRRARDRIFDGIHDHDDDAVRRGIEDLDDANRKIADNAPGAAIELPLKFPTIPGDPRKLGTAIELLRTLRELLGWDPFDPQKRIVSFARSYDPNDKLAPGGHGNAGFIQSDSTLDYTIRFENMADATAPAREVIVTDTLDVNLDLDTFELTEIAFADYVIGIPPGLDQYEDWVPATVGGQEILVEVEVGLDHETRVLTLALRSLDPVTGWFPEDPFVGLLYPNDETGRGEGHISFLVRPLADLPSGTEITNWARIYFDYNDPIDTPLVRNTLDAGPPTSWVQPLAAVVNPPEFLVTWDGADDAGGSGIARYDIYVSSEGGPFTRWLENVTDTSALFSGQPGSTYAFYSVATDNVGHRELAPPDPEATTYVNIPPTIGVLSADPVTVVAGSELTLKVTAVNDPDGEIQGVTFYRDTNGDGVWDPDDEVLEGTLQVSGEQWTLTGVSTDGWDLSTHTLFARAQDNHDGWSEAVATVVVVAQMGGARIEMRIVTEPSETDAKGEAMSLPESAEWVHAWQSFWVEFWVSMDETTMLGVAGAVVDLQYNNEYMTAQHIEYGTAFTEDRTGMIDDAAGQVTAIGGRTERTDAGRSGYVLLARVRFASTGDDQVPVDAAGRQIGPYDMQIALTGGHAALVHPGLVIPALGEPPATELWAVMYDIDGNHRIDFGELSFFAAAFGRTVDAAAEPPYVWWADFDKSGRVDFGDLAFFAPNFNKTRTAVQSGAQTLIFPPGFPGAWRNGHGEPTGEGEAAGGSEGFEPPARVAGIPLGFDRSQVSQAPWWNVVFGIEVTQAFVHEERQSLVPDPAAWLTGRGRELPNTRPLRDTSPPETPVEHQPLRFDGYDPLEDLLPLLADRPTELTDLDAYFAAMA